jgi:hemin uptake protein HemP
MPRQHTEGMPPALPPPPGAAAEPGCTATGAQARRIDTESLLQGQRQIELLHQGEVYRLQVTRLGKLILTK